MYAQRTPRNEILFSPHTAACATQCRGDRERTALWAHSKVVEGFLCRFTRYQKNSGEEGLGFVHSLLRPLPFSKVIQFELMKELRTQYKICIRFTNHSSSTMHARYIYTRRLCVTSIYGSV